MNFKKIKVTCTSSLPIFHLQITYRKIRNLQIGVEKHAHRKGVDKINIFDYAKPAAYIAQNSLSKTGG